jgi:hypothetical protein
VKNELVIPAKTIPLLPPKQLTFVGVKTTLELENGAVTNIDVVKVQLLAEVTNILKLPTGKAATVPEFPTVIPTAIVALFAEFTNV